MSKSDTDLIRSIIKDIGKKLGDSAKVSVMGDGAFSAEPKEFVPSSVTLLNHCIGGGAAIGRMMEILGDVQTGKSLLSLDFLANNQKGGGISYYLDAEYGTSKDFAKRLCHVDEEQLGHLHIKTQEDAWKSVFQIVNITRDKERDKPIVIVLDSLAALCTVEEMEADFDENSSISKSARVIRGAMRKLNGLLNTERVAFIFTNHEIAKINAMAFGEKTMSWGGSAPKYFASSRLKLDIVKQEKVDGDVVALRAQAKIVKNRFDPPGRKIEYLINVKGPHLGVDDRASLVDFLNAKHALGSKKGWVEFEGSQMRRNALVESAWNSPEIYDALKKKAIMIFDSGTDALLDSEEGIVPGIDD